PAKVVLEELVGASATATATAAASATETWVDRGTRHDEVALVLKDVLGMGLEQFVKVVLLPQGEFAAFLRATPEERRSVLEKLFDTRRFTDVESWLAERRRLTAATVGSARAELSTGLLRVDDVLLRLEEGEDILAPAWSEVPHADVGAVLSGLVSAVDLRAGVALAGVEVATATVARTESGVHQGVAVLRHQRTATEARACLAALDEQRGAYLDAVSTVELSERAVAVSGFAASAESANQLREVAMAKVADLRQPLAPGLDQCADKPSVQSVVELVDGHSDALAQAVAQAARADSLASQSAQHTLNALADDETSVTLRLQQAEALAHRAASAVTRDAGRTALAELPGFQARHKSLTRVQQLLTDQKRSAANLETLQHAVDSADRLWLDARERLLDLRERRLAGMAAELATGLLPGGPCPVCGSSAHPMPATTTDPVSSVDIRSAEGQQAVTADALSLVRSKVTAELAGRETRALELAAIDGDETTQTLSEVEDALLVAAATIDEAKAAAAALPGAELQIESLTQVIEQVAALVEAKVTARASSRSLAASTSAQAKAAGDEVMSVLASHGRTCRCRSGAALRVAHGENGRDGTGQAGDLELTAPTRADEVAEVVSLHRQRLAELRLLVTGLQDLVAHEANADTTNIRLSTALQDNGFETLTQAKGGLLPPAKVAELTALMRAAEQQRAQATALLAQPDVSAAVKLPVPDELALAQAHAQAASSLGDARRRHTLSEQAQRDLRGLSTTVRKALADLGPAEEEARLVSELADCVAGNSVDNALRMRLSSYVLSARLAEIATLANERLGTMSDGRYTLEYTDARAAKGARSGLGLLVRDAWTGRSRETSSLSGGEAFMASLALALGLGDAVRAEAGGFDLKTLFVDEGFGSLDEDSLEQVMAVLDTLREGGRAVGIVSHVTELRQRIPQQLHVIKEQAGSSIRVDATASSVA
ncbi:MAG: SbcC/MukB-like Walker B domain-containing protein, partial [Dermatophilaceae bacterium]